MKNILLVDDDPTVSETLVGLFDKSEYRFHQLEDGNRAIEFIDNNGKRVILEGEHTIFINDGQPDEYTSQLYNRSGLKVTFTIDSSKYINY